VLNGVSDQFKLILPTEKTPLIVEPKSQDICWQNQVDSLAALIKKYQRSTGALLFRGFNFDQVDDFYAFVKSFGHDLLSYEFGSTPRSHLGKGVYTSTEYPAHQIIPQHNEQAYTLQWPLNIWFHCVTPAQEGGETPIGDSRLIYKNIDPAIRQRFEKKGLLYVRNYGNGLDVPWEQAFNTEDKSQAEKFARNNRINMEWKDDGELRTHQLCQATAKHPYTGDWVWFNQAHLFHVSNLDASVREMLLDCVDEEDLPRNVYYGDGSPIEESILHDIRAVIDEATKTFSWEQGDVMLLDNMLTTHGRLTFKGDRKVVVAMTEAYDSMLENRPAQDMAEQEVMGDVL